jgi:hypothetical protein
MLAETLASTSRIVIGSTIWSMCCGWLLDWS